LACRCGQSSETGPAPASGCTGNSPGPLDSSGIVGGVTRRPSHCLLGRSAPRRPCPPIRTERSRSS
jgi:hypothetical protein